MNDERQSNKPKPVDTGPGSSSQTRALVGITIAAGVWGALRASLGAFVVAAVVGVLILLGYKVAMRRPPNLVSHFAGLVFLGATALGTVAGLVLTFSAIQAVGLSEADRMRVLSNGIAEAIYCLAYGLSLATPLLTYSEYVQRRRTSK